MWQVRSSLLDNPRLIKTASKEALACTRRYPQHVTAVTPRAHESARRAALVMSMTLCTTSASALQTTCSALRADRVGSLCPARSELARSARP